MLKDVNGWWFPESETHMSEFITRFGSYQEQHRKKALWQVKRFRSCIEIGGHVGTWGRDFSKLFDIVHCFEPMAEFRECYIRNVTMHDQCKAEVVMYPYALGDREGKIIMKVEQENTGHSHIDYTASVIGFGEKNVAEMRTLDSFYFANVDFIKCDAEGAEEFIMKGATETIRRHKPIICVEQKAQKHLEGVPGYHGQYGAVEYLHTLGMKQIVRTIDDIVMGF